MNICESYLTIAYSKMSGASSCRWTGIAKCLHHNQESLTHVSRKDFDYLVKPCGVGPLGELHKILCVQTILLNETYIGLLQLMVYDG